MAEYTPIIVTVLICTVVCIAAIWLQNTKYKQAQRKWERIAEDNYHRGKDDASQLLRETYDKIEEDKNKLSLLSDRELILQILLALGSYGRRLDRMDTKLKCITNYKAYLDDINERTRNITQSYILLENDISATSSMIHRLQNTIGDTASGISTLIEEISSMDAIHHTVQDYIHQLSSIQKNLETLQSSTASIVQDMNAVMDSHNQSPMRKLKTIEMDVSGLNMMVKILLENVEELSSGAENLERKVDASFQEKQEFSDLLKQLQQKLDSIQDPA